MLKKISLLIILLSVNTCVYARWTTFADAPVEILQRDMNITVHADGTCEIDVIKKLKILNERGRESNSKLSLIYNFDNSKLTIVDAKTIVDGKEYPLDQNLIEDKPLASDIQGFDQNHQVLLAYPHVKVGSILYIHYNINVVSADVPGFFEYMLDFVDFYMQESNFKIKSALPLFVNSNDPDKYLEIIPGKDGEQNTLQVKLLKPIYISLVDEKQVPINPKKYPWVFVASTDNWDNFAQKFAADYLKILQQPLPPSYEEIVEAVRQVQDPIEQISLVSAMLNDRVQYMGDWKTANGRHIPQNLADVTNKRLGDCKDFATGMAAILQKLGIKANVTLVQRGTGVYDTDQIKLPGAVHFNHAMVRVELSKDRILWVDPTNFFGIADKVLPDIADRQVLVLDHESYVAKIPQSSPRDNEIVLQKTLDLKNNDLVKVNCTFTLKGLSAVNLTGAALQVSQDTIDNAIVYEIANYDNIVDKKVVAPKLDSRIVKDLTFKVDYTERNMLINTNAGKAILIKNPSIEKFVFNEDQVADVYLGAPKIIQTSINLTSIEVTSTDVLDYTLQSPWVDVIRTVKYKPNAVTVDQKVIIKEAWLYNETIKSTEYKNFVAELSKHFKNGVAIVFN